MTTFKDRVAIVTGGASGIGRGLCEELGRLGAVVIVADLDDHGAQLVAATITAAGVNRSAPPTPNRRKTIPVRKNCTVNVTALRYSPKNPPRKAVRSSLSG